jgi:hypothetical protein
MVSAVKNLIPEETERIIINHCGPVLFGGKPSALFIVRTEKCYFFLMNLINQIDASVSAMIMRNTQNGLLVFFYKIDVLNGVITEPDMQKTLHSFGYPVFNALQSYLGILKNHFTEDQEFPHEIGFFLGYPADDVLGFIRQKGKNYKYRGLWKVYGDVNRAIDLFQHYENCRESCKNYLKWLAITPGSKQAYLPG